MRISDWSSDVCSSDLPCHCAAERESERPAKVENEHERAQKFIGCVRFQHRRSPFIMKRDIIVAQTPRCHGKARRRSVLRQTAAARRSEEHTSELQSLMRISYAVFCLKKKKTHAYTQNPKPSPLRYY